VVKAGPNIARQSICMDVNASQTKVGRAVCRNVATMAQNPQASLRRA